MVSKANVSGLATFIDDVQSTKLEVANLRDDTQRIKAEEKLINKLEEYENGLSTLEAKTEQNIITYQFQEIPTSTPPSTGGPTSTPTPTLTPVPTSAPTLTPIPSPTLLPTNPPATTVPTETSDSVVVLEQRRIAETIKETKQEINKIKKDLEEKRERRSEQKENRDKRDENERKDKENRGKRDNSDNK